MLDWSQQICELGAWTKISVFSADISPKYRFSVSLEKKTAQKFRLSDFSRLFPIFPDKCRYFSDFFRYFSEIFTVFSFCYFASKISDFSLLFPINADISPTFSDISPKFSQFFPFVILLQKSQKIVSGGIRTHPKCLEVAHSNHQAIDCTYYIQCKLFLYYLIFFFFIIPTTI